MRENQIGKKYTYSVNIKSDREKNTHTPYEGKTYRKTNTYNPCMENHIGKTIHIFSVYKIKSKKKIHIICG